MPTVHEHVKDVAFISMTTNSDFDAFGSLICLEPHNLPDQRMLLVRDPHIASSTDCDEGLSAPTTACGGQVGFFNIILISRPSLYSTTLSFAPAPVGSKWIGSLQPLFGIGWFRLNLLFDDCRTLFRWRYDMRDNHDETRTFVFKNIQLKTAARKGYRVPRGRVFKTRCLVINCVDENLLDPASLGHLADRNSVHEVEGRAVAILQVVVQSFEEASRSSVRA